MNAANARKSAVPPGPWRTQASSFHQSSNNMFTKPVIFRLDHLIPLMTQACNYISQTEIDLKSSIISIFK